MINADLRTGRFFSQILIYSVLFVLFLAIEIFIGEFAAPKGFVRCYLGDVLIMPVMFCFVRIFTDKFEKSLPVALLTFACFVEFIQSVDVCGLLGIDKKSLLAVIIGTSGDIKDILCYVCGTILIYIISKTLNQGVKLND